MFTKPAVALVILLTILAVSADEATAASCCDSHSVTVNVPAFDVVALPESDSVRAHGVPSGAILRVSKSL